jgi:beta-glucosidase
MPLDCPLFLLVFIAINHAEHCRSGSSSSVLWSFGHGLSYGATFKYQNLSIALAGGAHRGNDVDVGDRLPTVRSGGIVKVSFTVVNNGTRAAEEVAQLYLRDELASVTTPVMQLRRFKRLPSIAPKEAVRVMFELDARCSPCS